VVLGTGAIHVDAQTYQRVSEAALREAAMQLDEEWRFRAGDGPGWASPQHAATDWMAVDLNDLGASIGDDWPGVGWFRLELRVDAALTRRALELRVVETGFADIYIDGELVRRSPEDRDRRPGRRRDAVWIELQPGRDHLVAVRWENHRFADMERLGIDHAFSLALVHPETPSNPPPVDVRRVREQLFFTAVPLAFALLQLLLYVFPPRSRSNLLLAATTAAFGIAAWFEYELRAPELADPILALSLMRLALIVGILTLFHLLGELQDGKAGLPLRLLTVAVPIACVAAFFEVGIWYPAMVVLALAGALLLPMSIARLVQQRRSGAWIPAVGAALALAGGIGDFLIDVGVLGSVFGTDNPWLYGALGLLFALSVYMARDFATTNLELARRLDQVRELSKRTLEQHREAHEQDLARRLLEADNERKTHELEDARALQISLLPIELPTPPGFELAARMRTATEVGGDFYDVLERPAGRITIGIGDAVGHGARAGLLVATTKGLFQESAWSSEPADSLARFHLAFRGMQLERANMALLLARLEGPRLSIASAAMPPPLVWRARTGRVEEITVGGLPLGATDKGEYRQTAVELDEGDAVLLFSDGLPEQCDPSGRQLGYERLRDRFAETASAPAETVLEHLLAELDELTSGEAPTDDATLMVLRRRPAGPEPGD
jgi:serine phosphatase RsbU (regulator of sigma subunit)